ncbi:D-alanyl-D-alanine carboxypeptidase family protein [Roseibium sp.]|uniref:D-alanyl-D-alanine carboxypeptidase family protein n=1 Tax=Roseibium sp. TaxID=1936156 RepID=UPI003A96BFC8
MNSPILFGYLLRGALRALAKPLATALAALALLTVSVAADDLKTTAPMAYMLAPESGTLLFAKEQDTKFSPGSLVKVMTAATVFKALADGTATDDKLCTVSEHAWRTGGAPSRTATMFAALKSEIPISDLLRGLLVHNANDAAIILAECLSGTEADFAKQMNAYAGEIGMANSLFINPTGFVQDDQQNQNHTTVRDMVLLAREILSEHADRYSLFTEPEFTWNNIYQRNRNPLLGEIRDMDGLGAGQDDKDGYSALVSVERDGRRVIAAIAGAPSANARIAAVREVIEGAWTFYTVKKLYAKGDTVADARIHDGTVSTVELVPAEDVDVLLPRGETLDYRLRVVYSGPLIAPVASGMKVGELLVLGKDGIVHRTPLVTNAEVGRGDMQARALDGLRELLFGWF